MKSSDSCDWKSFFILKILYINKILSIEIKSFISIFWGPRSCKGIVSFLRITGLEFYLFCWDMKHMSNIRLRYRSFVIVVSVNTTNHKIEFATLVWLNCKKKWSFPLRISSVNVTTSELVIFSEKILKDTVLQNEKAYAYVFQKYLESFAFQLLIIFQ